MTQAGWHPDPSGRFGQRWYDGTRWTDRVVGAQGSVHADALPENDPPFAPPLAPVGPYPPLAPPPQTPWFPPAGPPRLSTGSGLWVGLVGLFAIGVSLLGAKWAEGDKTSFLDIGSRLRKATGNVDGLARNTANAYFEWAGLVVFVLVTALVLAACIPVPRTSNRAQRIVGALAAALAEVLHATTVGVYDHGTDLNGVAYVGIFGYLVVGLGFVLGAKGNHFRAVRPLGPPGSVPFAGPPPRRDSTTAVCGIVLVLSFVLGLAAGVAADNATKHLSLLVGHDRGVDVALAQPEVVGDGGDRALARVSGAFPSGDG